MSRKSAWVLPVLTFGFVVPMVRGEQPERTSSKIPVVTVCEALRDRILYNGKSIVVVGRLASTDEGRWLTEDCDHKIVTEGYTWGNANSTTHSGPDVRPVDLPQGFKWDESSLKVKLKQGQSTTTLKVRKEYESRDSWAAMFGRFETRAPLQVARGADGKLRGYGFGHLNSAPAQLVSPDEGHCVWKER